MRLKIVLRSTARLRHLSNNQSFGTRCKCGRKQVVPMLDGTISN